MINSHKDLFFPRIDISSDVLTCDGYVSVRVRNSYAWNIKMLFYVLLVDLVTMATFVFYQMELPITFLSVLPAILNIYLVVMPYEQQEKLFKLDSRWLTLYYLVATIMFVFLLAFGLMFLTILMTFQYSEHGYYPSIGWGFM